MKNLIIILSILVFGVHIQAQNKYPAEHSSVLSDRAFYVSGEEIQFSGNITIDSVEDILSSVVYIELIDPLGNKINQQKYYLNGGNSFEGRMIIPESTISGYYFLRAYTKWMRNQGPNAFDYITVKIVNPFLLDIQQLPDSLYKTNQHSLSVKQLDHSIIGSVYSAGDSMEINLQKIRMENSELLQLSIVPAGSQYFYSSLKTKKNLEINKINFYPETRGLSLSGTILKNGSPSPYQLLYLNLMGEKDFQSGFSDSAGRFYFSLPKKYYLQELMIGAAQNQGEIDLLIDNDYESESFSGKVDKFKLNSEEEFLALQLARQYQINKWYFDSISEEVKKSTTVPFYREVPKTIDFDFYIPLDSMSQYFTDIPSYVLVKRKNGKRYLRLLDEESNVMSYEPLILVDWIPVDDAERVLAMNPTNIKNIDVVNHLYYHGNQEYGGIIHIHTRERNMADLKFPESNIYLNYQFPEKEKSDVSQLQFPGTAFNLVLDANASNKQLLQIPDLAGKYILLIQQIDKHGEKSRIQIPFEVLNE